MTLNHLNLTVTDVPGTVALFETYFGFRRTAMDNANMAFMRDDHDAFISMFRARDVSYPGMFHIGFTQETEAQVDALYERLVADGFTPTVPREDHGRWTFYFESPGGVVIEVQKFHRPWY